MDTVPTVAVIWSLYGVGSRCVSQNDRVTYRGPTLLCRWWFRTHAGTVTQRTGVFWMLTCRSIVYAEFLSNHLQVEWRGL